MTYFTLTRLLLYVACNSQPAIPDSTVAGTLQYNSVGGSVIQAALLSDVHGDLLHRQVSMQV